MSCENIPSLLDLQKAKLNVDDLGRLMGTGTGTSTNGVTGQVRPTINKVIADAESEFDATILNMGFSRIGKFSTGATLTNTRQVLLNEDDGQEYGWTGAFPKVVPPSSTPSGTGGIAMGAWVSRYDPISRIQAREALRRTYAEAGLTLVAGSFEAGGTLTSASDVLLHEVSGKAYGWDGVFPKVVAAGGSTTGYHDASQSLHSFNSVYEMQAHPWLVIGSIVKTAAFNAAIDQVWLVSSSTKQGEFCLPLMGGLYAIESSGKKYLESFGATGDGVTLDDAAFLFAAEYSGFVEAVERKVYAVSAHLDIRSGIDGKWSTVNLIGSNKFATVKSGGFIGNFIIDGLDGDHTDAVVSIDSPSSGSQVGELVFKNFYGRTSTQTYCLQVPAYGAVDFKVGNQWFYNIKQEDDGVVTGKGFCGGLYIVGLDAHVSSGPSSGVISDIYGDTVKSVSPTGVAVQDSDLVRVYAQTVDLTNISIKVGDITGINIYKRILKVSSLSGLCFGKVTSYSTASDHVLFAAVECLSSANNITIGNVSVYGASERALWLKGSGHLAGDVYDAAGSQCVIFGSSDEPAVSCQVGNIIGRGNPNTGGVGGTGVTFLNSTGCGTGRISGLFAISINQPAEAGKLNSVESVSCNGRLSALSGLSIGAITANIIGQPVGGTHFVFGGNVRLTTSEIVTDGRVTVGVIGTGIDVDIGRMLVVRASAVNGVESSHSIFNCIPTSGKISGSLQVEANNTVLGTPSGSSGKSLVYMTGVELEGFSLSVSVTAAVRGATGLHYFLNAVSGYVQCISTKSELTGVGAKVDGNLTAQMIRNIAQTSTVTCTGGVGAVAVVANSGSTVSGLINTPVLISPVI